MAFLLTLLGLLLRQTYNLIAKCPETYFKELLRTTNGTHMVGGTNGSAALEILTGKA